MKRVDKSGQMKLSFGMIFSIILIIIFVAAAFYAIGKFLDLQKALQVGQFVDGVQFDVDKIWKSPQGSTEEEYSLPKNIQAVCFVDYDSPKTGSNQDLYQTLKQVFYEYENMIFYPVGSGQGIDAVKIDHIDIAQITASANPLCFDNVKGKVTMTLKMNSGDSLVCVGDCGGSGGNGETDLSGFCGSSTFASCSSNSDCGTGGCSGQVCEGKDEGTLTTCQMKDCYKDEDYGVSCGCVNGKCRWS
jgi:eight-cysteine-cluster-containing protein